MTDLTLLTICGALRAGSTNRLLLAEAARLFGAAKLVDADLRLPLYDNDLEDTSGIPDTVQRLAENRAEFVGKGKITQTHPSKSTGGKFCEHVDIASLRVEIAA